MDCFKYKVLETYYYEKAGHRVRVDIADSLTNELPWKRYSIATLCCKVTKKSLDEKDREAVINQQVNDLIIDVIS
ncbi:hypothetical protein ACT9T1_08670 [Staphylococcus xylosus]|uniref:hypothetical protein n=1 Tax=Staphylococcus xylosus TaxID=1288 RepID=UPI000E6775FA|nr:hypothetical protein [Staphylococcus xylosus]RIM77925.1 hypothetical protein BU121_07645 [Staphylococcus xylosus]